MVQIEELLDNSARVLFLSKGRLSWLFLSFFIFVAMKLRQFLLIIGTHTVCRNVRLSIGNSRKSANYLKVGSSRFSLSITLLYCVVVLWQSRILYPSRLRFNQAIGRWILRSEIMFERYFELVRNAQKDELLF